MSGTPRWEGLPLVLLRSLRNHFQWVHSLRFVAVLSCICWVDLLMTHPNRGMLICVRLQPLLLLHLFRRPHLQQHRRQLFLSWAATPLSSIPFSSLLSTVSSSRPTSASNMHWVLSSRLSRRRGFYCRPDAVSSESPRHSIRPGVF